MSGTRRWRGVVDRLVVPDALLFAVLVLIGCALLAATGTSATVLWLDVGSPGDEAFIDGFFPRETNADETYRWSETSATLDLPMPADGVYEVDLALGSAGANVRSLTIACAGDDTLSLVLLNPSVMLMHEVVRCSSADGVVRLQLDVPAVRLPSDGRPLGVSVRDVRVTAEGTGTRLFFWTHAALALAALIVGLSAVARATGVNGLAALVAISGLVAVVAPGFGSPARLLPIVSGPGSFIALAGGLAALRFAEGRRTAGVALTVVAAVTAVVMGQPELLTVAPARWVAGDGSAMELLPWLAVSILVVAAVVGGTRARWLAALGSVFGVGAAVGPLVARAGANRWSATIAVPDWMNPAPVAGLLLIGGVAVAVGVGVWALSGVGARRFAGTIAVVAAALAILLPWRDAVMLLNGDEPHYYVTARSIADDGDLELLDDYLEPEYLAETISPTGNIAVRRDVAIDRISAWAPVKSGEERWQLVPTALEIDADDPLVSLEAAEAAPILIRDKRGQRDALPVLEAGELVAAVVPGACQIQRVWVASVDGRRVDAEVIVRDASGGNLWGASVVADTQAATVAVELSADACGDGAPVSVTIASQGGRVVAQVLDTRFGLKVTPARPTVTDLVLGGLPRDRFATVQARATVAMMNPGVGQVTVLVRTLGSSADTLRIDQLVVLPGETEQTVVPVPAGAAVQIRSDAPVFIGGTGSLACGTYPLIEARQAADWSVRVAENVGHDAGVWLTLANPSEEEATFAVVDGTESVETVCGFCAVQVHLAGEPSTRTVVVRVQADAEVGMSAVGYEQRTGWLHFDPGLPLLAALPARIGGPGGAFVVSAVADVLLAAGVFLLLRREIGDERVATVGAVAVALLLPVSPFAVRLYTEVVAAAAIVWVLVCWQRGWDRERRWLIAVQLALALALPFIHGRYAVVASALALLALTNVARGRMRWVRWRVAALVLLAVGGVGFLAAEFAVGLRERASTSYLSPEWLPHTLAGVVLDRGSGLLPIAPWLALAVFARNLSQLQRVALVLIALQTSVVLLRDGGWQSWGPPGRYLLPVVPLLVLLVVPVAARLWTGRSGRVLVLGLLVWSACATVLLHWVPLSGYVSEDTYLVDTFFGVAGGVNPLALAPRIRPQASSALLGVVLLAALWGLTLLVTRPWRIFAVEERE